MIAALGMLGAFWLGTLAGVAVMALMRAAARADAGLGIGAAVCAGADPAE